MMHQTLTPLQGVMLALFIVLVAIYISFSYLIFSEILNIEGKWTKRIVAILCSFVVGGLLSCFMTWLFGIVLDKVVILLT